MPNYEIFCKNISNTKHVAKYSNPKSGNQWGL